MRFLTLFKPSSSATPPSEAQLHALDSYMDELTKAGLLIATGGILSRQENAVRTVLANGRFSVTRNPPGASVLFDSQGWAILEAPSEAAALEALERLTRLAGDGSNEITQIVNHQSRAAS